MSAANLGTRARRARVYFRLMDIVLVLSLLGFAEFLLDKIGGIILIEKSNPIYPPVAFFFGFMNFIVPLFLILARFMRDEYAELLWRRTAVVVAYMLALAPWVIVASMWAYYFATGARMRESPFAPLVIPQEPVQVIWLCWLVFMLLFVAIFQFLRWRDGR